MSGAAIIGIAIAVFVVLAAIMVITSARRADKQAATGHLSRETRQRDKAPSITPSANEPAAVTSREVELAANQEFRGGALEPVGPTELAPYKPVDPEQLGVTRRQFMNRSMVTLMGVGLGGFGASLIGFLWPSSKGGFGSVVNIGTVDDTLANIAQSQGFYYVPNGRAWITHYPPDALPKARKAYDSRILPGMEVGIVALYQKCVHLGCRVPQCLSSQWFECPCHGSQYNRVGEKKGGPAPRGLDRFAVQIKGGEILVDTGNIVLGPAIGTNTTGQEAEGPHCVTGGEGGHH
jgi:cytochrome b6-f complex iron-sulfur subunit